ncbi:SDR family oxidoreductase [Roseateles sp. SL47]|uniref:SDR family oxidoreductase n=1 Tax=Roseateles sp. SL47 TaxID=2995138 RepID=UPI00226DFAD3|nr:SDR family oxidoreductase [Roseateles sp. SL47]WAC75853.1 SDR family oxidoreductase [Roseateles sp. SL47]
MSGWALWTGRQPCSPGSAPRHTGGHLRHFFQSFKNQTEAGSVGDMSSVHRLIPWAGHTNFAASKGGVDLFMRSLVRAVSGEGIRVNAIAPAAIATAIHQAFVDDPEARDPLLTMIPYGRIGDVSDVAQAVVWLASDAADFVVGTTLLVDGGMSGSKQE